MGRHRRHATPAPVPRIPAQRIPAQPVTSYGRHRNTYHQRGAVPVRTGLFGVSTALAMGAVAVASGLVPGPGNGFTFGDDGSSSVQADDVPNLDTQGTPESTDEHPGIPPADRGQDRAQTPDVPPSEPSGKPTDPPAGTQEESPEESPEENRPPAGSASEPEPEKPAKPDDSSGKRGEREKTDQPKGKVAAAMEQVLRLVNKERVKAGCQPVTADKKLAELATEFSRDMAVLGFFSHISPDGSDPWARAEAAGISNLGGENIARGQADARSVMEAWISSPEHRANILNCDYKTLGTGVHFGPGGPWWTQNFGF
jgi:uncharacterized protein YkwD